MTKVAAGRPIKVVRVISRLNVGGPAIQAITLTRCLVDRGYETTLVRGSEGEREGNMDSLAAELGVAPLRIPSIHRELGRHDARALGALIRLLRRVRPDVLHTHAAKAGTIGRVAALLAGSAAPPVRVHTFHGHVLTGYFGPAKGAAFRAVERALARSTTRLIAVSEEVCDDLVRLGIAPSDKIDVVRLGFDLSPFVEAQHGEGVRLRRELGLPETSTVITLVARLVPIKRVDVFLQAAEILAADHNLCFLIVGDGELGSPLRSSRAAQSLGARVVWAGMRKDMPAVVSASDVVCLTSDNEGTPVSLIEAAAGGRPVVSTRVGGVESVVRDGVTGHLTPAGDAEALAERIAAVAANREAGFEMGEAGRRRVLARFSLDRLVDDVDGLYRRLLSSVG